MQNKQLMLGAVGREQSTDKLGAFFDGTLCLISFTSALHVGQTQSHVNRVWSSPFTPMAPSNGRYREDHWESFVFVPLGRLFS